MTSQSPKIGGLLRGYLALRPLLQPLMRRVVQRRVASGKDDPVRSPEKLGIPGAARPEGALVWMHAVGLGEVLALRPLIAAMAAQAPELSFLITSTARSSGQVLADNLPPRTQHQFLPLDGPEYVARFLDHWRPDLSVWAEQDLWPGAIYDTARRGIPLAYINARITEDGFGRRRRLRGAFSDIMRLFAFVAAQDARSVSYLSQLGAASPRQMQSLKPAAAPLRVDASELTRLREDLGDRPVWVAASTHPPDEPIVMAAHKQILKAQPNALLVLAPRVPQRADEIAAALTTEGLSFARRGQGETPGAAQQVFLADSFGEMGLWYSLGRMAFVGGSFAGEGFAGGGHNPWEPVALGCPVMAGPDVSNFAADYAQLSAVGGLRALSAKDSALQMANGVLQTTDVSDLAAAQALVQTARTELTSLATELLDLLPVSSEDEKLSGSKTV